MENKISEWKTTEYANLSEFVDNKNVPFGNLTIGFDAKGNKKAILSVGEKVYSGFVNKALTKEQREKVREFTQKLVQS